MKIRLWTGLVGEIEIGRNNNVYVSEGLASVWKEVVCSSVPPFKYKVEAHGRMRAHQNGLDSKSV